MVADIGRGWIVFRETLVMTLRLFQAHATLLADSANWYVIHITTVGGIVYLGSSKNDLETSLGTQRQGLNLPAGGPYSFWWRGSAYVIADGTPADPNQQSNIYAMVEAFVAAPPIP